MQYQAALARGAERAQAQVDAGDTGRSITEAAARPGAGEDAGQGGAEHASWLDAGDDAGRGGTEDAARPGTEEGGETAGDASELTAGQVEGEVIAQSLLGLGTRRPRRRRR